MKTSKTLAAAFLGLAVAGGAFAQQNGLVNVDVSNVANNIAKQG